MLDNLRRRIERTHDHPRSMERLSSRSGHLRSPELVTIGVDAFGELAYRPGP